MKDSELELAVELFKSATKEQRLIALEILAQQEPPSADPELQTCTSQ